MAKTTTRRKRIAKGVYRDRYSLSATVKVGTGAAARQREKRFPFHTPLKDIKAWQGNTRSDLTRAIGRSPESSRGPLADDATAYLTQVTTLASYTSRVCGVNAWTALRRAQITSEHVRNARGAWLAEKYTTKTVNNRVQTLRHLYRVQGADAGRRRGPAAGRTLTEDPGRGEDLPHGRKQPDRREDSGAVHGHCVDGRPAGGVEAGRIGRRGPRAQGVDRQDGEGWGAAGVLVERRHGRRVEAVRRGRVGHVRRQRLRQGAVRDRLAEGRAALPGAPQRRVGARGARHRPRKHVGGARAPTDHHDAAALCPGARIPAEGRQRAAGRRLHGPDEDSDGEVGSGLKEMAAIAATNGRVD
jgi:hypothetical protein